jgi:hypothetical protein
MKKDYTTKDITASSTSSIEEALHKAVKQVEVGEITTEPTKELSSRVKVLLAKKKNLQRRNRQHIPKKLR